MATAMGSHAGSDPFDLDNHIPLTFADRARAAQLRNSSPVVDRPIGVSPAPRRPAQTPSSPLDRLAHSTATEGAQPAFSPYRPSLEPILEPVSIVEGANRVAQEQTDAYNAKLAVFHAFCESFDQAAKQFTSGIEHTFANQFATSFLDFWRQSLSILPPVTAPTYSSVAAGRSPLQAPASHATAPSVEAPPSAPQQTAEIRLQGRPIPAPPKEDLRVFVRLDAEAPARKFESYAIRTHIAAKVGIDLHQIPAAFPVNSGWAIRTADATTGDLLVQRQSEWADDLGTESVEVSKKWYTYVVSNCPRRLTDLQGNEADYDEAVKGEINCQTGQTAVNIRPSRHDSNDFPVKTLLVSFLKPTQKPWRLFGSSRLARYIDKPVAPRQCDKCWDFHARHSCDRRPSCKRCGKAGHDDSSCAAPEQCGNCLGPHAADFLKCPARPIRSHGAFRRLTKEEKSRVREMGAQLSAQLRQGTAQAEALSQPYGGSPQTVNPSPVPAPLSAPEAHDRLSPSAPDSTPGSTPPSVPQPKDSQIEPEADTSRAETREQTCLSFQETTHRPHLTRSMTRYPRPQQNGKKNLRIFQANVGKIPPAHDCALALADADQYDVVLLQEPWTEAKEGRCLTKTHPAYDTFSPVDSWANNSTRPRVMTYVRRRPGLTADQRRPAATRDILWLTINNMTIVNCYRQLDFDRALDILLAWSPPSRCLVVGDFNAKHYSWQTGRLDGRGDDIAHWAAENCLSLLNPTDVPTNPHGNTIDLAFSNVPLSEAVVEDHLATSSDHFTLSITLPEVGVAPMPPGKVRVTTEDEIKRFVDLVQYGSVDIPAPATTIHDLDALASALVRLLKVAAKVAGRLVRKQARSAPWWTEECRLAAAEYRAIRRVYPLGFCGEVQLAKKDFQKVVRQAKRLYWRNLIDSFNDSASVFKAVRWLKSPGAFQPPPLEVDVLFLRPTDSSQHAHRQ
ncbi:reverse transcriptase [Purpureocillium lavendulum]|uniref:Reverse transcriptase n=1 Tax=Purpureocillium lavendulum TaxID=1247861 RepID=A0AB34FCV1_9HYPO|nr:reverse transcriptase [Purpureocillium lavendulum]